MTDDLDRADVWRAVYAGVPQPVMGCVARVIEAHAEELTRVFTGQPTVSLGHADFDETSPAVSVSGAVQRWLTLLVDGANCADVAPVCRMRRHMAQLFAEAGWRGFGLVKALVRQKNMLKHWVSEREADDIARGQALAFIEVLFDTMLVDFMELHEEAELLAGGFEALDSGFAKLHAGTSAGFSEGGLLATEAMHDQERQMPLGVLTEEENRFLRSVLEFGHTPDGRSLGGSVFGLWFSQRAPLLFDDAAMGELNRISQTLTHLDGTVLPRLADWLTRRIGTRQQNAVIRELVTDIADIRRQVNALFDRLTQVDGYRDVLTQLFSRRFLPTILRREIELARRRQSGFSALLIDVGNFDDLTALHGTHAGNRLLQHVAGVLSRQVRASDFVFRYGVASFLVLLAELEGETSLPVADKLLRQLTDSVRNARELSAFALSVNAGIAAFDGDPDSERLTHRAELAVDAAKRAGAGQIRMAD